MTLVESKVVGHYRGEDSGAIYPEFDYDVVEAYDLNPIKMKNRKPNDRGTY